MGPRNLYRRWQALWHPERYHGWGRQRGYFEGWYFKLADPAGLATLAVIPGISIKPDGRREAFVQVLDGQQARAWYHPFAEEEFRPDPGGFAIRIGKNHFSDHGIRLDLPELRGELQFHRTFPWPRSLGAPGIMGWYAFMPFMECYHGVWSMHHNLSGSLRWQGRDIDFGGGLGYGEKDWGTSFPKGWIWTQSNHFEGDRRVSVMASLAHIPWMGSSFVGFIGGILLDDRLFRFATYTGARRLAVMEGDRIRIGFRDRRHTLTIEAESGPGAHLLSPLQGEMTGKVNESLQATLQVELQEEGRTLFRGTGIRAGLEAAGEVDSLLANAWSR